ncbi:MAG: response regulator transcription factor [Bacteroidota bacterium]
MRGTFSARRMLIIEDDLDVGAALEAFFALEGFRITRTADGEAALQHLTTLPPYDVVLLDVMLPRKTGFDVLREARRAGVDSPVILLTVRGSKEDKLLGFELGADDYMTKPFNVEELALRVRAVMRRASGEEPKSHETFRFADFEIDFSRRQASMNGSDVPFTTLEFDILRYFVQHRGRTVSRKQLLRDVWGISGDITTRTIDRHVASLRKKIERDPAAPQLIETVYGIGYKFTG